MIYYFQKIKMNKLIVNIRNELRSYIQENNIKSLILGISGGIDSTLCAILAKPVCKELNIPLIGRSLPSFTNNKSENDRAKLIGERFCTEFKEVNINETFYRIYDICDDNHDVLPPESKDAILSGNMKARIRMILLYDLAGGNDGMVLSTDNYTEYLLGFWTLHGDVGDFGMIQSLWKTEVYDIVEWIRDNEFKDFSDIVFKEKEILSQVLTADATGGLGITSTDLDQIMPGWSGTSRNGYKIVDDRLKKYLVYNAGDLDDPVIHRYIRTKFKRKNPINISRDKIYIKS